MAVVCTSRRLIGVRSIIGGGDLSADRTFELYGDVNQPGNLRYYGTDASGNKGWHALPSNILDLISLEARVAALEDTAADHETRITDLEATVSDHETRILALEAYVAVDGVTWAITGVDYSVATGVNHVKCTALGITITLPAATSVRKITVKNQTDGIVTVTSVSLIDSVNTVYLAGREAGQFVADGTLWNIT